ncbi:hypothetical protein HOY80DRAFT_1132865 [Tuber brumale]|nr:hypothetical protein HOY80DRAFT_1132865 [Tuber brumale]
MYSKIFLTSILLTLLAAHVISAPVGLTDLACSPPALEILHPVLRKDAGLKYRYQWNHKNVDDGSPLEG